MSRKLTAKRNRQYGITRSKAISDLATFWLVTHVGSTLTTRDTPPKMAKESATQPAPRIRWRTHCSVVSAASRTNSTTEMLNRTCVQCVNSFSPPPSRRPSRQGPQRSQLQVFRARVSAKTLLLAYLFRTAFTLSSSAFTLKFISAGSRRAATAAPAAAGRRDVRAPHDQHLGAVFIRHPPSAIRHPPSNLLPRVVRADYRVRIVFDSG